MRSLGSGLLIALAMGAVGFGQPRAARAETIQVALFPVAVNSSLSETAHLSAGLGDMIAARLEQSGQILVLRLDAKVRNREEAIAAGQKAGAEYVLFGSYTQFGDGASLDLRCAPVAGDEEDAPRRVFVQAGSAGEIIPQLEVLSQKVTTYLLEDAKLLEDATAPPGPAARENPAAPAPDAPDAASLAELELRVEALERVIFAPPPAAQPAAAE
jgi:hypothetical protein